MDLEPVRDLYRHMTWGDAQVWTAVLASPQARADRPLRDLLHHVHLVQHIFLAAWRGTPLDEVTQRPAVAELTDALEWGRAYHEAVQPLTGSWTSADLAGPMPTAWVDLATRFAGPATTPITLGDSVLQAPLHSLHHRAQINMRLRDLGLEPPIVDYIYWVWLGRPAAEWPAASA